VTQRKPPGGRTTGGSGAKRPAGSSRSTARKPRSPARRVPAPRSRPRVRRTRGLRLKTGPFRLWSAFCVVAFVISLFAARLIQLQGIDENALDFGVDFVT